MPRRLPIIYVTLAAIFFSPNCGGSDPSKGADPGDGGDASDMGGDLPAGPAYAAVPGTTSTSFFKSVSFLFQGACPRRTPVAPTSFTVSR